MWVQQVLQREGIEVRRIPRDVNSADCLASHNAPRDVHRGIVRMGGKWLGVDVCFRTRLKTLIDLAHFDRRIASARDHLLRESV